MSKGVNKAILMGNLGADGELRYTQGGAAVLNLRLAVTTEYKQGDEWKERTTWFSVVVWGKRGEALAKIVSKGDRIYVEGELRTSSYDDKDGQKREKTEVHADEVLLCGGSKREGGAPAADEDTSFNYGANAPAAKPDDRRAAPPAKGNRPWEQRK